MLFSGFGGLKAPVVRRLKAGQVEFELLRIEAEELDMHERLPTDSREPPSAADQTSVRISCQWTGFTSPFSIMVQTS